MTTGFYGGKFFPLHMGHVSCIMKAATMVDILYIGISQDYVREQEMCTPMFKHIHYRKRLEWIEQLTKDMPNVHCFAFEEIYGDNFQLWLHGANQVIKAIGNIPNIIFGSEPEYGEYFDKLYPGSEYKLIDVERSTFNISATTIRTDGPFKHWDMIPDVCNPYYNKKVVIIGTESCGKSTLVKMLAKYYNTQYVGEYGRTLCEDLGTGQPLPEHYPYIAYGQKMEEYKLNKLSNKLLFIDTEAIVTQYYLKLYEEQYNRVYEEIARINDYDLILYLEPDVDWVDDGMRIHGDFATRMKNNRWLKELMKWGQVEYKSISGNYQERLEKAIQLVDALLESEYYQEV